MPLLARAMLRCARVLCGDRSTAKLRAWYERMLHRAAALGIVSATDTLQEHTQHLTSVRDFPLFEGDYFPDRVADLVQAARGATTRAARSAVPAPPPVARHRSAALADEVKREVRANRQKFLVATLQPVDPLEAPPGEGEGSTPTACAVASELLDSRLRFLETCRHRHWQFDELRHAQWTTMMMLATLGGSA